MIQATGHSCGHSTSGHGRLASGLAGDVLLPSRDRALPHRHNRLPQRGDIHSSFLPLLGKHPPMRPPHPLPLHRRPSGGPAGQAHHQYGLSHAGVPPGPSGPASEHARWNTPPPSKSPQAAFPGAQYAPLRGACYSNCPWHAGQLSGGWARHQKKPRGAERGLALAKPPGIQALGPPANPRDLKPPAHPRAVARGAKAQPGPRAGHL